MSQKGFTLIELMVALAVLAILLGIAVPSFSSMLRDSRASTLASELQGALQLARSEAIKRRQGVVVCRRKPDESVCQDGTDWAGGWLVQQTGGDVIKVWDSAQGLVVVGPNAGVSYRSNGMASTAGNFSVTPSGCSGQQMQKVTVSVTGSSTLSKDVCQ
ncbi:GspH/FimT family pseudopilin [Pseudomonas sp.]|uniref:GspH/FimT family pseudopilin n=1 Tax=Pseudomonas sp. TaxID=306 RepID=UPI002CDCEAE5|nr:GspH/FimT family pseudopilin [Pseudomonas sp.]HUE90567.1 GspH/FimT family pseudopilin [Pseudomonas sp.]